MLKEDYELWKKYRLGLLKRTPTQQEISEIRACEFAMELLLPTSAILNITKNYGDLEFVIRSSAIMKIISDKFRVDIEVATIKIQSLINIQKEDNCLVKAKSSMSLVKKRQKM